MGKNTILSGQPINRQGFETALHDGFIYGIFV